MEAITQHDVSLMSALLLDGMDLDIIGEKFEIPPSDVIQHIYPPKQFIPAPQFESRSRRGTLRLGEDGIEKRCSRCRQFFPIATEFWHNCRNSPDGFLGWCRACELERATAKRKELKK
ncbi:TPA: hypothetical protein NJ225_004376 [Vibrio parahaemolyticus]|nr:hypothetical protein [Vibrio parahaemolyticus]